MWAWGRVQTQPLRWDTVTLGTRLLGLPQGWELCWEEKPPSSYVALSEPLLLLLPATSVRRGDLHPSKPSITPLSAGRTGQVSMATPFSTACPRRTSALGPFVLMVACCPHRFADCFLPASWHSDTLTCSQIWPEPLFPISTLSFLGLVFLSPLGSLSEISPTVAVSF